MNWKEISTIEDLEILKSESNNGPVMIFKHSTRCGTSALVKSKLERKWNSNETGVLKPYFIDLIRYQEISNQIASEFGVYHESPQVLIIRNEKSIFDSSHFWISYSSIIEHALLEKSE